MDGGMLIATSEARNACAGEADIQKRIEKAMKATRNHWMETNEQNQFKAAVAAAMLESDDADKDRIKRSFDALSQFSAMIGALQAGVPVDLEAMVEQKKDDDLLPLMPMWRGLAS